LTRRTLSFFIAIAINALPLSAQETAISYPDTKRIDHVDDYHGTEVADPYRWLEDDVRESEDVAAWVEQENEATFAYLHAIPERDQIEKRITELWNYERYSTFFKEGGRYYFFKNDGLQNQSVLYMQDSLEDEPEMLLNPNVWSEDGTTALSSIEFSEDSRYAAYARSEGGSDWQTVHVMEIESKKLLDDQLDWVKFSALVWTKDGEGFFYTRFPQPEEGAEFQSTNLHNKLYYHRVGTPQSDDVLVYERPDEPEWGFAPDLSSDGRHLVIHIWKGTDARYRVLYKDLAEPYGAPVELIDNFDQEYTFIDAEGSKLYFLSDLDAPRRRVITLDLGHPDAAPVEIVAESEDTLTAVTLVGDLLVADYLKDARSSVRIHRLNGDFVREVELPGIGTAGGFSGSRSDLETFYSFSGYAQPPTIYRYDMLTGASTQLRQAAVNFDSTQYVTEQVFYTSKDGTRIPMFLTHKEGLEKTGANPTLLYGYGGFNISITPAFSVRWMTWLDLGGLLAVPNLRGGGEYGEDWHQAGIKQRKQNVFDDFIAAAEWLIENDYTRTDKLAIHGRSNGGLLVGAVMTQRPELFGAALPGVGVMDMLRFHQFTAGRYWVDDYGSADNEEEFPALLAYSPYHNLDNHSDYPPTLVTTADTDDRVVPGHSFKFAAELQHNQQGDAPVLIRIETSAGHGAGLPTSKRIEELADTWAFLVKSLGMTLDYMLRDR
jgi:prolyl oligopeptidase